MWSLRPLCAAALAALAALAACSAGAPSTTSATTTTSPPPAADAGEPIVVPDVGVSLSPLEATLAPGATQKFAAVITGSADAAVTWSIDEIDGGSIDSAGEYTAPLAGGTYHVRARSHADDSKSAVAAVTVTPPPGAPSIASFDAAPATIIPGGSSRLSWSASPGATVSIQPDLGTAPVGVTSIDVTPNVTTRYTLTASNAAGSVTASATVAVVQKPFIGSFSATPMLLGGSSTLSWTVAGATSVSIDQGIGAVTGSSRTVAPATTTAYMLTASNAAGSTTAVATVPVLAVDSFSASPGPVAPGSAVTLSWAVSGAATLAIDHGVGAVAGGSAVVRPTASTTYKLTAANGAGSVAATATVTVNPAGPVPHIASFSADSLWVLAGGTTTLRWTVANASSLSVDRGVGAVAGSSAVVAPVASGDYTLTATNGSGSATARVSIDVDAEAYAPPSNPGAATVTLALDSSQGVHPISRLIYGYNATTPADAPPGATALRLGGNRWTAYDWENNASNAGSDWLYQSDDYLGGGNTPGEAIRPSIAAAQAAAQPLTTLVTLAMQGWVASDKNGTPVSTTAPVPLRFSRTAPRKGTAFASPDGSDGLVYQDELADRLRGQFPAAFSAGTVHFSLDNEPDLWAETHREIQRAPLTYAGLLQRTVDLSAAVKDVAPSAMTYGPASYGFYGYVALQGAPDQTPNEWFLDYYLRNLKAASDQQGRRLLDVLDLHWYSEATAGADHIVADVNTAAVRAARAQAPRSLWDASYRETSWIADWFGGPIKLLPRLKDMIAQQFPGTKLAFTEYNHGGDGDISGAVAQADTLGIFGRDDVYAAYAWPLRDDARAIRGAFRSFRSFDGQGAAFGDTSFKAASSDDSIASIYASLDRAAPGRVVAVAINKTATEITAAVTVKHPVSLSTARVWRLDGSSPYDDATKSIVPKLQGDVALSGNAAILMLPAYSVTTLELVQ